MKKLFVLTLALCALFLEVKGQNLSSEAQAAGFGAYRKTNFSGGSAWENDFESYKYPANTADSMWFRLLLPNDFNSNAEEQEPYPLFIFFHGAGEGGVNNRAQLRWGGQMHRNAVRQNPVKFEGLLLYPQAPSQQNWKFGFGYPQHGYLGKVRDIVVKLVNHFNVDPTRIYINGLSMGGGGTWEFFLRNPEMVATAYPMCDATTSYYEDNTIGRNVNGSFVSKSNSISTTRTPLWYSQGGLDRTDYALPGPANELVDDIRNAGGEIRYLYFPGVAHDVWDVTWAQSDYFSNMLSKSKLYIIPLGGQTSFCSGTSINLTLTITAGYAGYEWERSTDGDNWSTIGSNSHNLAVTQTGYYRVRFNWGSYWGGVGTPFHNTWTDWSESILIDNDKPLDLPTTISSNGRSVNLQSLDGANSVNLVAQSGLDNYQWSRNGSPVGSNSNTLNTSIAGEHTVRVWSNAAPTHFSANEFINSVPVEYRAQPAGCISEPSNVITVTTTNGPGSPIAPNNFFVTALSSSQIKIDWDDRSDSELGFEIYRATQSGGPYQIITITESKSEGSNPQSYIDEGLAHNTQYFYRMRAVNQYGGSAYTQERLATTAIDNQPPTPPTLSVTGATRSSIFLEWTESVDNVGVIEYEIYMNGVLATVVTGNSHTFEGLTSFTNFSFYVRAKDAAGNISSPSNQVNAATINQGLTYRYYSHNGLSTVDNIQSQGTLLAEGISDNFLISLRNNHPPVRDDNFAFVFEGFLNVPTNGNYKFYLSSDDGSKLYINDNLVVNHDGNHGCNEKTHWGWVSLNAGFYSIRVLMYENTGGECLTVSWQRSGGFSKQPIPNSALRDDFTFPPPPNAPSNLDAQTQSYSQINLSWADNSNNESGFEIFRRVGPSGDFTILTTVAANEISFEDNALSPSTQYFYRIRAINSDGSSEFSPIPPGSEEATTHDAPAAPALPSNLIGNFDPPQVAVALSWTDNATNELGFEIYRTTSAAPHDNWTLITTTDENATQYVDDDVYVNGTYYYRIRSKGEVLFSDYTSVIEVETNTETNSPPVIAPLANVTMVINEELTVMVEVSDPDEGDVIALDFDLDPEGTFAEWNLNDDGIILSPEEGDEGVYTVSIAADDGAGGTAERTFTLTVLESPPVLPPSVPANVNAIATGPTTVNLTWTDTENEDGFRVYRAEDFAGPFVEIDDLNADETDFEDATGLSGNTTYYYRIAAFNSEYPNVESAIVSVTTLNSPPVIEPIGSIYLAAGESITIDVEASDPEGDNISLIPINFPSFMQLEDQGNGSGTITITSQPRHAGNYGDIRVMARDILNGESSEEIFVIIGNTQFEELIYINFDNGSDAGDPWNNTGGLNGIADLVNANGVNSGISFSYTGWTSASDNGFFLPSNDGVYDNAVIRSRWTANGPSELIFDNLNPGLIYNILVFGSDNSITSTAYTVGGTTKALNTLNNGSEHVYFNVSGQSSATVSVTQGVVNAIVLQAYSGEVLPAPTNLIAKSLSYSSIELRWQGNAGNATGYEIFRRELPSGTLAWYADSPVESFEDTGLPANTSFEYAVRAVSNNLRSAFTPSVKASTFEFVVQVNFNADPDGLDRYNNDDPTNIAEWGYWNNINYFPGVVFPDETIENALTISGESTSIGLSVLSLASSGINPFGVKTGDDSGVFPDTVRITMHYIGPSAGEAVWQITGLDQGKNYNISLLASVKDKALGPEVFFQAFTEFEVNGVKKVIDAIDNVDQVVLFEKLSPSESNEITFKIRPAADYSVNFGVINAFTIQAYKNPDAITPSKTYYAQNAAPINVPGSWRTEPDGGDELGSLTEDGNELIISEGTRTLAGDVNFGGIGTKVRVTGNAEISISAGANDIFFNALEVEEGFTLTFNGTGGKNIRIGDGGLTIADGASIDLGGNSLTINGNATINKNEESGKLVMNEGSLTFNSTSQDDSHLYFDETANNVDHLIINNTGFGNVQLMTPTRLRERLKLSAGNLDTHDKLVLVHDGDGVALLDKVEVGASLTGRVEYQRYWERANNDSNFGYYHLGVPVKDQTFIDWHGDFHIQGARFSFPNRFPNVQRFDEATNKYVSMIEGTEPLVPGRAYTAFMYSSELADGNVSYKNTGYPIMGSGDNEQVSANEKFNFPLTYTESSPDPGWNFVANPYPCIIDLMEVDWENDANDIDESVYVYNSEAFGYIVWNYEMVGESDPLKLYPGQGFFIKANGPNPLFRISENVKTTDKDNTRVYRKGSPENVLSFAVENTRGYRDKAYFGYRDNATLGMDPKYDAKNISGKALSITSVFGDSLEYSINAIPESSVIKVVPIRLATSQKEQHKLTIDGISSMHVGKVFYLHDKYLNVTTQLPREEFEYPFEVNTDTASYFDRFSLLTVPKPMLSIGIGEGFSEERVLVKMIGENLDGIARMQFEVKWDPSQLKFNSLDSMNTHLRSSEVDTLLIGEGILRFYYESETGVLPDIETMFNLNFTPLVDGTVADVLIESESVKLFIEQDAIIPTTTHSGKINILSKTLAKGSVLYKGSKPINNVRAKILPDLLLDYSDSNGEYGFTIKEGKSYSIHIEELKCDEFEIDVIDLIVLARHLYGRSPIHHPIDLLSADIDGNGTLNHKDFNELAKSIFSFRKNSKSPVGKKWIVANRFSSSIDGELPQPRDFAEVDDIFDFDIDFNVSILGDIATNFDQGRKRSSHPDTIYLTLNQVVANRDFYYSIEARNDEGLVGFQYSIEWNTDLVQLKAVEYALPGLIYDLDEEAGILKVMWVSDQEYIDVKGNTSLIGLRFEQLASLKLENPVVFADGEVPAVFIDGNLTSNAISIESKFGDSKGVNLISNYPNPFENSTTLSFSLNESENIEIVIYNAVGEPVGRFARTFEKGYHEWVWQPSPYLSKGIYFFNIRGTNSAAAGKMIYK